MGESALYCFVAILSLLAVARLQAATQYNVIGVGTLSTPHVNDSGEVSGVIVDPPLSANFQAVLWSNGTTYPIASVPVGYYTQTTAINNYGQVIVSYMGKLPALWTPTSPQGATGTAVPIGDVNASGSESNFAQAINSFGQVAGEGYDFIGGTGFHGYIVTPSTPNNSTPRSLVDIGTASVGGAGNLRIYGLNDSSEVVGQNGTAAFLYKSTSNNGATGQRVGIGSLSGGDGTSTALAVNNSGSIVGRANVGTADHAFVWTPAVPNGIIGTMTDLTPGTRGGTAYDIDDAGAAVGAFITSTGATDAFVWTSGSGLVDLNTLISPSSGWTLQKASDISNSGLIVGTGLYDPDGPGGVAATTQAFMLVVPEPASLCFFLPAVMAIALQQRVRQPK